MSRLTRILKGNDAPAEGGDETSVPHGITQQLEQAHFEQDMSVLEERGVDGRRVHREVEREVRQSAQDSLKRLHMVQMGRCPACGEHIHRHLFASTCEACGWHRFDTPDNGPVRVHLRTGNSVVDGERCYTVKSGAVLVLRHDVVVAKVPRDQVGWIEYVWSDQEIDRRHRGLAERVELLCGWCGKEADSEADGFHLVHVAFGASQERYCFCSDDCYEAFRKMYPSRVHRNCYERACSECDLCHKRYDDEAEGMRLLAKDLLVLPHKRSPKD